MPFGALKVVQLKAACLLGLNMNQTGVCAFLNCVSLCSRMSVLDGCDIEI
jgi:hypothetical protein